MSLAEVTYLEFPGREAEFLLVVEAFFHGVMWPWEARLGSCYLLCGLRLHRRAVPEGSSPVPVLFVFTCGNCPVDCSQRLLFPRLPVALLSS